VRVFKDNSAAVIEMLLQKTNEAIAETAEEVGNIAQANAPVRTGELRDSKVVEIGYLIAWIGFTAKHAIPVHWGTIRQAANPFLLAAMMQAQRIFTEKLKGKF
jgi:hypothetical protein